MAKSKWDKLVEKYFFLHKDGFFGNAFQANRILENTALSNLDYTKMAKAEKMILQHLHLGFGFFYKK